MNSNIVEFETKVTRNDQPEWVTLSMEFPTDRKSWDFASCLRFANNVKGIRFKSKEEKMLW